ncbi:MAG: NAD(P)-binding domain-containing protein, partial [Chromatiales bacterium]|nr:NAD(P)-binding domain-containing protein [Chromatiales bacterium]
MATIGFIGIGNMGGPMLRNLTQAGHAVKAFDVSPDAMNFAIQVGAKPAASVAEAAANVQFVVSMLPVGKHVREVYLATDGVIASAAPGTILIDSSTIDVDTAVAVHNAAAAAGFEMIDAPVSGGTVGAEAGTLTFMCGGERSTFEKAKVALNVMGKNLVLAGGPGLGQGAKICNNMITGITAVA